MLKETHFVIFKNKNGSRYSITEFSNSGVKQAFMSDGTVVGDEEVLTRLSRIKPENESIVSYIEKNAGHLIYARC